MSSPFFESIDNKLSELTSNKIIKEIKHIDNDVCIKILFSDNSSLVVDSMLDKTTRSGSSALIYFYDVDGEPIDYVS